MGKYAGMREIPCMLDAVNSVAFVFVHRQNSPLTTGTGEISAMTHTMF